MRIIHKAVAAVIRDTDRASELLVFRHPVAGVQIPKGTVEGDETIEAATLRELKEESGLELSIVPNFIGTWERIVGGGPDENGPLEINIWHISILKPGFNLPKEWSHHATGSPAEEGLIFDFFWEPIDNTLSERLDPLFAPTVDMIHQKVRRGKYS